jgi:hypothetical protein
LGDLKPAKRESNKRMSYLELDWEQPFPPLYGSPIIIPENTILWRSYDISYPAIGNRFAYYSSKYIAEGYKQNNRELGHFISTRPIRLLDYRFMKVILSRLIHTNNANKSIQYIASIIMSFGLCSLKHQINLIKQRYISLDKNTSEYKHIHESIKAMEKYYKPKFLIEQTGVRVAETTNDIYTMGFLQELFKDLFDGFISPRMYSPFHTEKDNSMMSPEIIIFNPKASGIEKLERYPSNKSKKKEIKEIKIIELLRKKDGYILIDKEDTRLEFFMCGGGETVMNSHYLDKADDLLNSNDNELVEIYNNGMKAGCKWRKNVDIRIIQTPSPSVAVTPFPLEMGT